VPTRGDLDWESVSITRRKGAQRGDTKKVASAERNSAEVICRQEGSAHEKLKKDGNRKNAQGKSAILCKKLDEITGMRIPKV